MPYQIKDWSNNFENDRSRRIDRCSFVCVPNKQHGMGFSWIMAEPDGSAIYGIWCMIVGACSQQRLPRNGWLTSDGTEHGEAWKPGDLAIKFRRPLSEIVRAFEVLSSSKIGWLTINSPSTHHAVTPNSPSNPQDSQHIDNKVVPSTHVQLTSNSPPTHAEGIEENGMEWKEENGIEEKEVLCPVASQTPAPVETPEVENPDQSKNFSRAKTKQLAAGILDHLNAKAERQFRPTDETLTAIACRLEEVTLDTEGVKVMIDRMVARWKGDVKMEEYLRPATLFAKSKFNGYYDDRNLPTTPKGKGSDHAKGF